MSFQQTLDNGGSKVIAYKLYRDAGDDFTSNYVAVSRYDGSSSTFTITVADDGLVTGKVYRFVYVATNSIGDSPYSNELIAGVGAVPPTPTPPQKNWALSTKNSSYIFWESVTTSDLPISGYLLYMDDGLGGPYTVVYDGSLNSADLTYFVTGLQPSLTYKFIVEAIDFNRQSSKSSSASFVSCVAPSGLAQPKLDSVTRTTFTIVWDLPSDNGGCTITGYSIYRDDGMGGFIVTPVDAATVAGNPYLFKHTATLASAFTGSTFRVKVEVSNVYGSVLSPALQFVLASKPAQPFPAPSVDITNTTTSQIKVNFANANPDNGGSPLILSELYMDDGIAGDFNLIFTTSEVSTFVASTGVVRGRSYRFRYRVSNVNGWSPFSEIGFIRAFSVPSTPQAPAFVSATGTSVTIEMFFSTEDNGSQI